jgi:hypothetical protein
MKTGPDALGIAENEFGRAKHEKGDLMPKVPPKTCLGAQNLKMRPNALGTDENDPGAQNVKMGPGTPVPPKMSRGVQNMKTGPDALGIAENEPGRAKHEKGTLCPRYHQKHDRERKT